MNRPDRPGCAGLAAAVDGQAAALRALAETVAAYGALLARLVDHIEEGGR